MESLTASLIAEARKLIAEVEALGGMTKAVEAGMPKMRIEEAAARKQARIDRGDDASAARPTDPLARDEATAAIEEALFLADEPLPAKKLAQVAGLADAAAARRALKRLQQLFDEAGTPFCITVDSQTLADGTVTFRDRDTCRQWRVSGEGAARALEDLLQGQPIPEGS